MATIQEQINQLKVDKQNLVDNLVAKGVEATNNETFTTLVPKVKDIQGGIDINDYFETNFKIQPYSINNVGYWIFSIKKIPTISKIIQNAEYLFGQYKGSSLDVSNLDISQATNMKYMFYFCSELTSLDVSNFDTSKVKNMENTFGSCRSLTSLDVSNFDTSNVTSLRSCFSNCSSLTSLDLSNWITSNVTDMRDCFYNCKKLTRLDIRNFDFSSVTSYSSMFTGVPADCLIIVKDDTAKTWITSKFTDLTNVKTVAELGE